ncbi:PaaI family thioesterase [Desulfogranum mediterraneum]|uniref:PaaI family thioesterase n=1 Tax=Desulfogranum mediterraneum TaxID=160661 RepID=UPI000413158E|nr:PaaI family thioesterase [Desulfogranum mediterraneum]
MKVRNPEYAQDVAAVFSGAPFIRELGVELEAVEPGCCRARVQVRPDHLQHLGRVHGGVISSLAGHAALGAAISVVPRGEVLVAPEFTFKMFRGVDSGLLQARATVVKSGAVLVFAESEVFSCTQERRQLLAKGSYTFTRV